ncbi:GntR family transcriptional regulator [Streptomyces sulfonofaciens]|uniref:GntR family transcriptional regulator n=1 Tax=Streptomyces sulfonofaciens TaxID=68272 RepID=A0A919FVE1_9ACTN|nr:GntR family transcriptional regulator [Streptomyces sulfonofaciens]GHH72629.1 GntR family transcriptional regulator [Streptomyces sulfonofaciens]
MNDSREVAGAILPGYSEPLWIQAVNLIHGEIEKGNLKPGARLAPERELCGQLGISRVTLRKALGHLVERGELSASHGRGWYVARAVPKKEWPNSLESFSETAARMGLKPHSQVLHAGTDPATFDEAERLSIAPGTPLFRLERVRLLDDVPIALDLSRIPLSLAPGLEEVDFRTRSFYSTLFEAGVEPARADSTIEATKADERAAEHLRTAPGDPLLVMHQLALGAGQEPLFLSTIRYAGDRYRLRTSFTRTYE